MKRFLLSIVSFIPILIIIYSIMMYILGTYPPPIFTPNLLNKDIVGHTKSRLAEADSFEQVDLLFLGSSHTYRGFDTRIFNKHGIKSFNLGSSAQTPLQTKILLERYLDKLNPKMIVYEVYPTTFSIDGIESFVDILSDEYININMMKVASSQNNIKLYNTLLYHFLKDPLNKNSKYKEPKIIDDDTYISGGYIEKEVAYYKHINYIHKNEWEFNDSQINAFNDALDIIKERDIKFVLVFAPITYSLYNSYSNNDVFDNMMNDYGDYYNFNEIITLNDSLHFFDDDHLNQHGVELFNKKLIEVLKLNHL